MDNQSTERLLTDLKHADPEVRNHATQELWRRWFEQKGVLGLERIRQAQMLLERGEKLQAEAVLTQLIQDLPDFAEAWNRRAVLYYIQAKYRKSLADCQQAVQLNPIHFGALHGIGLCHVALGEYREAILAFRRALEIQPYSVENQRLILECSAKLS
ncbi:MAG: tetratricopeptide repeat protein [Trichocoleus desertorum ATA4-8-CV12]|jgi:tetratricopeptide (TPR) repeat protein|nr:tetratricopeptide repeat protein [Trichocoleus desertorum ATA4-8-CV12]